MTLEEWKAEARRYAGHAYCYSDLVEDGADRAAQFFNAGESPYAFVDWYGERYDLDRQDTGWGVNAHTRFVKRVEN